MPIKIIVVALLALLAAAPPAGAQGQIYGDPPAYCRVFGTIDVPDSHYTGPIPDSMLAVYFSPQEIAAFRDSRQPFYGIAWRCVQGEVLVCRNAQTPSCMRAGTDRKPSPAMREFCQDPQHSASVIPRVVTGTARMLAYDWVCRGTEPTIAKETPLDARGFVAADWKHFTAK
ncbi:MAG: hypothetical protein ACHQK9_17375 [Reyranellales bacterium]